MFNWSDPNQNQGFTAAQSQAAFRPETVSIAPIVAAIMRQRYEQQQLERQQQQDLYKGVGEAVQGYYKGQQAGVADDAANAAMYGAQYPNDPYGGYMDPNKVPDYGGTDALKTDLIRQKLSGDPLKNDLTRARTDAANALANSRWSGGSTGGTSGYDATKPETVIDEQGREWRRGNGGQWFPMFSSQRAYSSLTGKNAPTMDTQVIYPDNGTPDTNTGGDTSQTGGDINDQGTPYSSKDFSKAQGSFDAAKDTKPNDVPPPTPPQGPGNKSQPGIRQSDVNQVKEATSGEMVRVKAPNGQTGSIPKAYLQDAIKAGYAPL